MKITLSLILSGMLALGVANAAWACGGAKKAEKASANAKVESAQVVPASDVKAAPAAEAHGCCPSEADKAATTESAQVIPAVPAVNTPEAAATPEHCKDAAGAACPMIGDPANCPLMQENKKVEAAPAKPEAIKKAS